MFEKATDQIPPHKVAIDVLSPVSGRACSLDESEEPVLNMRLLGEGVLVNPSGYQVVSPFEATVKDIDVIGSRIELTSKQGIKLKIITGWDSDTLMGEGFEVKVKRGQKVQSGQELLTFNLPLMKRKLQDPRFVVTVTNSHKLKAMKLQLLPVMAGKDTLFTLYI